MDAFHIIRLRPRERIGEADAEGRSLQGTAGSTGDRLLMPTRTIVHKLCDICFAEGDEAESEASPDLVLPG
jgi:hypothetical protein